MLVYFCRKIMLFALPILVIACFIQAQEIVQTEEVEDVILIEEIEFHPTEYQQIKIDSIKACAVADKFEEIKPTLEELFSKTPGDIDALVQIIFFEVMKDELKNLEEAMQTLHEMNEMKKRQRAYMEELKKKKTAVRDSLRKGYEEIHASLDEVETMLRDSPQLQEIQGQIHQLELELNSTEEESKSMSLRLQIMMDKRNSAIQNLSNILEIDDDTRDKIIKNLK